MLRYAYAAFVAAGLGLSGTAQATDLYNPETPEYVPLALWTGFYVGGHLGGAFGKIDVTDTYNYVGDPVKNSSLSTTGILTGVQIGYNWQNGNIVYGLEAELGYMDLSGNKTTDLPPPNTYTGRYGDLEGTYTTGGGIYGDLAARVGVASDNALFYVKGGPAFLNADFKGKYVGANCTTVGQYRCDDENPSVFNFDTSDTLFGWTIGAGVEYALNSAWSLKVEYQYFNFGNTGFDHNGEYHFSDAHPTYKSELKGDADFDTSVNAVKVGLNYQVGKEDALK